MLTRDKDILFPIIVIVLLSLAVAVVLFIFIKSTATIHSKYYNLGGAAAGFVIVFTLLRNWYNRLYDRRLEELAFEIARLSAASIVKEGGDDIALLNTAYNDIKGQLKDYFKRQDKKWINSLLKNFRTETIRQVHQQYTNLRSWQPEEVDLKTVIETLG